MTPIKAWFKALLNEDQRKASRSKTPPLVAYFWDGGEPVARPVRNISPTGFFLATQERWLLGTLLMVTLQRTKTDAALPDCSVIVMSKVVHHGQDGVGFAFLPVESATPGQQPGTGSHAADRKALDRFLRRVAADRD
ncbi:MAG: PilZ domain-containing protein [Acidobacteriaceae bacterium]